jgi:cytochrome P450
MAVTYGPLSPEFSADPFPVFHRLQAEDPLHWNDRLGGWILTRYGDVKLALMQSVERMAPFVTHRRGEDRIYAEELARHIGQWSSFVNPPYHTHLRQLMNRGLSPVRIEQMRPRVHAIVNGYLDRVGDDRRLDVMRDFAHLLPIAVMGEILGVPTEDVDQLRAWADELNLFVGTALRVPDKYPRAGRSVLAMTEYFRRMIAERRQAPRDDVMSLLITAELNGVRLTEDELVSTCVNLTYAGHVTTAHLIGNAMLGLMSHPDQLAALAADLDTMPVALEELLRYDGPIQAMTRIAADDVMFEGGQVKTGDRLFPLLNAANRDPAVFADPDRLDLKRTNNRHIVFGQGPHYCIGAPLARLEAPIALEALLRRFTEFELAGPPVWLDSLAFRGMVSLPLAVRRR